MRGKLDKCETSCSGVLAFVEDHKQNNLQRYFSKISKHSCLLMHWFPPVLDVAAEETGYEEDAETGGKAQG